MYLMCTAIFNLLVIVFALLLIFFSMLRNTLWLVYLSEQARSIFFLVGCYNKQCSWFPPEFSPIRVVSKKKSQPWNSGTSEPLFFSTSISSSLTFLSELFFRAAGFWLTHGTNWESLGSTRRMRSTECFWWLLKTKLECPSSLPHSSCTYLHCVPCGGTQESRKPSAVGASISWWVQPFSW